MNGILTIEFIPLENAKTVDIQENLRKLKKLRPDGWPYDFRLRNILDNKIASFAHELNRRNK